MESRSDETRAPSRPKSRGLRRGESPKLKMSPVTLAPSTMSKTSTQVSPAQPSMEDERQQRPFYGQLSATQTKVVTTTTTTTTSCPPIMLHPPRQLHDMDPKQYPLAATPTPPSIKMFSFDVGGIRTTFEEADDLTINLGQEQKVDRTTFARPQQVSPRGLKENAQQWAMPAPRGSDIDPTTSLQTPRTASVSASKRAKSPVSISEAANRAQGQDSRKRKLVSMPDATRPSASSRQTSLTRLRTTQTSTPLTPEIGSGEGSRESIPFAVIPRNNRDRSAGLKSASSVEVEETDDEHCQVLSPTSETAASLSFEEPSVREGGSDVFHADWPPEDQGYAITPNPEEDLSTLGSSFAPSTFQRPSRPSSLNTAASHDASLPSPSLSPVTAAATLHNRRNYFDNAGSSTTRARRSFAPTPLQTQIVNIPESGDSTALDSQASTLTEWGEPESAVSSTSAGPNVALMKIPGMITSFEAMPEEMKNYIMYQMLRRCSKPVLHFVADVVNPALKCDFLRNLPVELCLTIIGHLDVKSLCAAAQVSKRWRRLVDSSEKVWKRHFDDEGFQLQEGELARAIREGWGWQFASKCGEFEQDLSHFAASSSALVSQARSSSPQAQILGLQPTSSPQASAPQVRRSKRKAKAKTKLSSRKQQKTSHTYSNVPLDLDDETFIDMASATEGPYAAATAAAAAVPYPGIGLPSLKNLHLFKSIYMRHHVIRKTWMDEEVTPRHIAFRAHQRHVVTCLQFDADKIVTGSDDSNINVYDTQTGALRATLEGHEGGVWALQYEGNVLVSGSTDRSVRVWDIERGVNTQTFQGHTSTVRCLQVLTPSQIGKTPDGRPIMMPKSPLIITGSRDSHLRVWRLPKPGDAHFFQAGPAPDGYSECPYFVRALTGHHHSVRAIAAHGDTLVSGSYDCTVRVWKISTGESVYRLNGHLQKVYSVVLDPKRKRCISGSMDNVVRVWSLETGAQLFNLEGHTSLVGLLDLQHDRLVSAAADSTLRIWDPESGQCKATLTAHTGAITCFQHDAQKVISGSDRTLKMWDVRTGAFVKDLLTDLSGVWQVKFNERRCVAAVQRNNMTYIEVLDYGALRDGVPESKRGRRILVNEHGRETFDLEGNQEQVEEEL